jgi:hypothetical protein
MSEEASSLTPLISNLSMDATPVWLDYLADDLPTTAKIVNLYLKNGPSHANEGLKLGYIKVSRRFVFQAFQTGSFRDFKPSDNQAESGLIQYRAKVYTNRSVDFKTVHYRSLEELDVHVAQSLCRMLGIDLTFKKQGQRLPKIQFEDDEVKLEYRM